MNNLCLDFRNNTVFIRIKHTSNMAACYSFFFYYAQGSTQCKHSVQRYSTKYKSVLMTSLYLVYNKLWWIETENFRQFLWLFSRWCAGTHVAAAVVGRIGTHTAVTRRHLETADSDKRRCRHGTLLPPGAFPCIHLPSSIPPTHHAGFD